MEAVEFDRECLDLRQLEKLANKREAVNCESDEEGEPSVIYSSLRCVCAERFEYLGKFGKRVLLARTSLHLRDGDPLRRQALYPEAPAAEHPAWISSIMDSNECLGMFLAFCYQLLTCKLCSTFFLPNQVGVDDQSSPAYRGGARESMLSQGQIQELEEEKNNALREELQRQEERKKELRLRYCPQSLSQYDLDSRWRLFFIDVIENPWFDRSIIFLIALNSLFLGMIDYTWQGEGEKPFGNQLADSSEIYFTIFFTMECVSKIFAMGVIFHEKCYLRDGWNWLDFIVVITSLIQSLPGMSNVSSLRTFRLFRPLRSLSAFPAMRVLVTTLFQSFKQLINILILDMFFILTFSLFGLQMWSGIIHYRCRQTPHPVDGDWLTVEGETRVCGALYQCPAGSYCGSLYETRLEVNGSFVDFELSDEVKANLDRDSLMKELNFGVTNFDTVMSSYLTIFQCTTLEGWFSVMKLMQDGYSFLFSSIFFMLLVIICSYFLLNLTVAIMLDNFKQLNDARTAHLGEQLEYNRHRVVLLRDLDKALGRTGLLKKQKKKNRLRGFCNTHCYRHTGEPRRKRNGRQTDGAFDRYDYKICYYSWKIIRQPLFNNLIMLAIVINTVQLALDQYPEPEASFLTDSNLFFTVLFAGESVLKLLGLTLPKFKADGFNLFDLFIVLASIVELMFSSSNKGIISSARAFRLARLFKLARSNHTLKCLLDSIAQTISALTYFLLLLMLFIYVFALLGMTMFAASFKFDKEGYYDPVNGELPRQHFDNLYWAVITVFQIMVGDQWAEVMFMAIQSEGGSLSVLYFVGLVLFGNFIMLNLFLAILLGNFEIASLIIRGNYEDKILYNFEKRIVKKDLHLTRELVGEGPYGFTKDSTHSSDSDSLNQASDVSDEGEEAKQHLRNRRNHIEEMIRDYQEYIEKVQKEREEDVLGLKPEMTKEDMQANFIRHRFESKRKSPSEELQFFLNRRAQFAADIENEPQGFVPPTQSLGFRAQSADDVNFRSEMVIGQMLAQRRTVQNPITDAREGQGLSNELHKQVGNEISINLNPVAVNEANVAERNFHEGGQSDKTRAFDLQQAFAAAGLRPAKPLSLTERMPQNGAFLDDQLQSRQLEGMGGQTPSRRMTSGEGLAFGPTGNDSQTAKQPNKEGAPSQASKHSGPANQRQESSFNSDVDLGNLFAVKLNNKQQQKRLQSQYSVQGKLTERDPARQVESQELNQTTEAMDTNRPLNTQGQAENYNTDQNFINGAPSPALRAADRAAPGKMLGEPRMHSSTLSEEDEGPESWQCLDRALRFMSESSLLFLHKETAFRKFLIRLTMKKFIPAPADKSEEEAGQDDVVQEMGGGGDGQDSDDSHNADQKTLLRSSLKNLGIELKMQFGAAIYSGETFEEMQKRIELEKLNEEDMRLGAGTASKVAGEDSELNQSSSSEAPEYQYVLNKPLIKRQFDEVLKNYGHEHELDRILRVEFQKKTFVIHQGTQSVGPRAALRHQKQLERDHEEMKDCLETYKQRLIMQNKYHKYKTQLQNTFPFLLWTLNTWFENTIYLFIAIAMILLVVDGPGLDPNGFLRTQLNIWDNIVSLVFLLEAIARILAQGFFVSTIPGKKGYFMYGQNRIDFAVSIGVDTTMYIGNSFQLWDPQINEVLSSFKVLRCLRALRPLKQISKTESLRLAIGSLFSAMPAIANGIVVCSLIIFIYAILGVNMFKGKFFYCHFDPTVFSDVEKLLEQVDTKQDCLNLGGSWKNHTRNFDSILYALPLLLEIITTEGWLDIMYRAIDARGIDLQPKRNYNQPAAIFFVSFLIIGNIFILNLFVGIVIDKYNRLKDKLNGFLLMTRDQRTWIDQDKQMARIVLEPKRQPPENETQLQMFEICHDPNFENAINFCIFLSTVQMAVRYYQMPPNFEYALDLLSILLSVVYNIEAIIKIIALDFSFFKYNWNKFDLALVVIADLALLGEIEYFKRSEVFKFLKVLKVLRILRVFRLIRVSKNLLILTDSLMIILPSVLNVGGLIILLFFMFAVIGNNMFSKVIHQTEINENNNFESFSMSIMLLMRCMTGEGWNKIMNELAIDSKTPIYRQKPDGSFEAEFCIDYQTFEQFAQDGPKECGSNGSYLFFMFFIVIIQLLMLNLFIAVVIEGFGSVNKEHTGAVTHHHYEQFLDAWLCFDPEATGWISLEDVIYFVYILEEPLGEASVINEKFMDLIVAKVEMKLRSRGHMADHKDKFFVNKEHNLIIPFRMARELLVRLQLPVYKGDIHGKYKCHFSHVVKRLTFLALLAENKGEFDPYGIEAHHLLDLKQNWEMKYPDLIKEKYLPHTDSGRMFCGLYIVQAIKKIVNQKKFNDKDIAYNWKAKEQKDEALQEQQRRKNDFIKKFKDKLSAQRKKQEKALAKKRKKAESSSPSTAGLSKAQTQKASSAAAALEKRDQNQSEGDSRVDAESELVEMKLTRAQQKKKALLDRLKRDEERRKEDEEKNRETDSFFTKYLIEEILIHGERFQKLRIGRKTLIERDRQIRKKKGLINTTDVKIYLGRALQARMTQARHAVEKKKKYSEEEDTAPLDERGDEIRSTWWVANQQQSRKFMRWMQNEQIREGIRELEEIGMLTPREPDAGTEEVIHELVEKLFDEEAIFDEENLANKEHAQKTLMMVRAKFDQILKKYQFRTSDNQNINNNHSISSIEEKTDNSNQSIGLLGPEFSKTQKTITTEQQRDDIIRSNDIPTSSNDKSNQNIQSNDTRNQQSNRTVFDQNSENIQIRDQQQDITNQLNGSSLQPKNSN